MNPPPLEDAPRVITLILRDIRPIGDFFGHLYLTLSPDGEEIRVRAAADYWIGNRFLRFTRLRRFRDCEGGEHSAILWK